MTDKFEKKAKADPDGRTRVVTKREAGLTVGGAEIKDSKYEKGIEVGDRVGGYRSNENTQEKQVKKHNITQSDVLRRSHKSNFLLAGSSAFGSQGIKNAMSGEVMDKSATEAFNLFTHQKVRQLEGTGALVKDYQHLRQAVLELFLSVKIRSDEEIDAYNKEQFEREKKELVDVDGYSLIDQIKTSIEILMNMKIDENNDDPDDLQARQKYKDTAGNFDINDPEIDIQLPPAAAAGLKDASQDMRLATDQMNEQLKKSLPLVKSKPPKGGEPPKVLKKQTKDDELNKEPRKKEGDELISDQQREHLLKKINQNSGTN